MNDTIRFRRGSLKPTNWTTWRKRKADLPLLKVGDTYDGIWRVTRVSRPEHDADIGEWSISARMELWADQYLLMH